MRHDQRVQALIGKNPEQSLDTFRAAISHLARQQSPDGKD
jgi:hypothetical protein